jgi:hypothetical protein
MGERYIFAITKKVSLKPRKTDFFEYRYVPRPWHVVQTRNTDMKAMVLYLLMFTISIDVSDHLAAVHFSSYCCVLFLSPSVVDLSPFLISPVLVNSTLHLEPVGTFLEEHVLRSLLLKSATSCSPVVQVLQVTRRTYNPSEERYRISIDSCPSMMPRRSRRHSLPRSYWYKN